LKKLIVLLTIITLFTRCNEELTIDREVFATTPEAIGNISFTSRGHIVYSHHPFYKPENRVMIMHHRSKKTSPFPNKQWNTPNDTNELYLSDVLGIRNDENSIVWMLDMGLRDTITPKVVGWNTLTHEVENIYYLDSTVTTKYSFPNDLVVDTKHKFFIIADEGIANGGDGSTAGFILVDMQTGETRKVLEGNRTTIPENKPLIIDGKPLKINGKDLLAGNDGITSDAKFEWIYYAPLSGEKLYRIKTDDLLNPNLTETELDEKIEIYSDKPNNGGMSIDVDGNLYLTGLETNSIKVVTAKGRKVKTIMSDDNLVWPDGISYNYKDGYMYVSASQVNKGAVFNDGVDLTSPPFYLFRFKPIAEGVPFR